MSPDDLHNRLTDLVYGDNPTAAQWWHRAALACWEQRKFQSIASRDGKELYLQRFWLTEPVRYDLAKGDGSPFESGDSVLLHFFARGDDDGALHDHPWDSFTTDVLSGGYTERRPALDFRQRYEPVADAIGVRGVSFDQCETLVRRPGGPRQHRTGVNQHAVEDVLPDTWTVVATGPRVRTWGFHPPGMVWTPWRVFLDDKRQAQAGGGAAS